MRQRIAMLLGLLTLVLAMSPLRAADEPYDLYVMLPLTGPAAFLGRDEAPTVMAAEKWANAHGGIRGRPLRVNIMDDQSSPTVAIQLANQIIAKKVPVIVGPAFGATCGAVTPLVEANGPALYCLTSVGSPPKNGYAFVYSLNNRDFEANVFRYMKAKGVRKIALLQTTDATGLDAEKAAHEALLYPDLRDMKIVAVEHYAPTDISVAAQVSRIKASGADAITNYVTGTSFGTGLRGIFESGFTGYVFTSSSNASKEQMKQYTPFLVDKLIFGTLGFQMSGIIPSRIRVAKTTYLDAIHQVGISDPTIGNMVPWDPMVMVIEGLRKLGPQATATQFRDYLLSLHDFPGMMGFYDFSRGDQRGIDPKSTGAMRYDKNTNEFVVISQPGGTPF